MMSGGLTREPTAAVGPTAGLPISVVAARTGIPQATLRAWQHRYGLGPSRRTEGGHRRYCPADIQRLVAVQELMEQGVPAGEAARLVLADFDDPRGVPGDLPLEPGTEVQAHQLAAAALDLDGPTVRRQLLDHLARYGVEDTWEGLLRPVLRAIGARWHQLPHGIAVEHLISHVTTVTLGAATPRPPILASTTGVVLCCAPDELHDLPLVALAAALRAKGTNTTLLGARTPAETLGAIAAAQPGLVMLVFALAAEYADPSLFDTLPDSAVPIAAGPGWDPTRLPPSVPHVTNLAEAGQTITDCAKSNA